MIRCLALGLISAILIAGCAPADGAASHDQSAMVLGEPADGTPIIDRLRETYWSCRTYRDRGTLTLTYGPAGQQRAVQWSFQTVYRTPRVRFAFGVGPGMPVRSPESEPGWCSWVDGGQGLNGPSIPGMSAQALRQFLSFDTLGTVPALLAADQFGPGSWAAYSSFQHVGYEDLNGARCLVINAAARPPVTKVTLWIDQEQYLLRRKAVEFTMGDDRTLGLEVADYTPTLDGPVEEAEFRGGS